MELEILNIEETVRIVSRDYDRVVQQRDVEGEWEDVREFNIMGNNYAYTQSSRFAYDLFNSIRKEG